MEPWIAFAFFILYAIFGIRHYNAARAADGNNNDPKVKRRLREFQIAFFGGIVVIIVIAIVYKLLS